MYQKVPDVRARQHFPALFRVAFLLLDKMAARFLDISDEDLLNFSLENENENTKKKTEYDLKIFTEYLEEIGEHREIETMQSSNTTSFPRFFENCQIQNINLQVTMPSTSSSRDDQSYSETRTNAVKRRRIIESSSEDSLSQ